MSLFIAGGIFMYCQENGISLCPVMKVRSEELQDNIQTISNTLCRIRDKSQKSLISTDLRFWDRFQSIQVSVNSSGHNKSPGLFCSKCCLLGRRSCWIWRAWRAKSQICSHRFIWAWAWPKAAQNHNTLCNYYFGLMVGQTNILSGFLSKPI